MRELQRSGSALVFVSHWLQAVQVLCPRTACMHRGRIVFDGPTEGAIARYHELLSLNQRAPGEDAPVEILERQLVDDHGRAVHTTNQAPTLTYRMRVRFTRAVESPQALFRILAEDSTLTYQMQTPLGEEWRTFDAGEETSVTVRFRPRLGGGGTFRIAVILTSADGALPLVHDEQGPSFFVEPLPGVVGVSDMEARIVIDDEDRTDQRSLRFDDRRPAALGGA
jgi:hypothetical protein